MYLNILYNDTFKILHSIMVRSIKLIHYYFIDESKFHTDCTTTDEEDAPKVSLAEMLDDLRIEDDPMGEGEGEGGDENNEEDN